jgi:hypothetical protein
MPPFMKYTADWREDGPGVVVITPGGIGAVRLVGLLFGAPGAWLFYQFLGGVLHPDEMTIFGWVMLPVMAAVFLIPAWIILVGRKRTRLDATRREATEEFDLLVYKRRKVTPIPRDAHVMLRYEAAGNRTAAHVYLEPGLILLAMFGSAEKPAALEFAHKVARFLGADVQDRCFEHGEIGAGGVVVDRLGPEDAD